jgi:hypothetical protein
MDIGFLSEEKNKCSLQTTCHVMAVLIGYEHVEIYLEYSKQPSNS